MANAMIPAMPTRPKAIPIPAAAPRDKPFDVLAFSELALAEDVGEGVMANVAVRTTVTDPGRILDAVIVGLDVSEDSVDAGLEVLVAEDVRTVLDGVEPRTVMLNGSPE